MLGAAVDAGAGDSASATIGCESDPRVQAYRPNLAAPGLAGRLSFILTSASPAPPAVGLNAWTMEVRDASGAVQDAELESVVPWMPDHGHGASVPPLVSRNPDGTYAIAQLDLFMVGVWQITVDAKTASAEDSAVFGFCVGE